MVNFTLGGLHVISQWSIKKISDHPMTQQANREYDFLPLSTNGGQYRKPFVDLASRVFGKVFLICRRDHSLSCLLLRGEIQKWSGKELLLRDFHKLLLNHGCKLSGTPTVNE